MPRRCDECSECCKVLPILELNKPRQQPCQHLCSVGCGIYTDPKKPKVCSGFRCEWLDGNLAENDRPDKFGVMFWFISVNNRESRLRVSETRPGAIAENRAKVDYLIRRIKQRHYRETGNVVSDVLIPYELPGTGLPSDDYEPQLVEKAGKTWLDYKPVKELALAM